MYRISTLLFVLALSFNAFADKIPYACQEEALGGLAWVDGKWKDVGFKADKKFIITLDSNTGMITERSAATALAGTDTPNISCFKWDPKVSLFGNNTSQCNTIGMSITFNASTGKGSKANYYANTYMPLPETVTPDSLGVSTFTCQKF